MKKSKILIFLFVALASMTFQSHANEGGENVVYLGGGGAKVDSYGASSGTSLSLGYIRQSKASDTSFGFDIGGEGITYHNNGNPRRSTSFNLLAGKNVTRSENGRLDAFLLLGFRAKSTACPPSNLGYQCYANETPKATYGSNVGGLIAYTYKDVMFGLRATGESKQFVVGFNF